MTDQVTIGNASSSGCSLKLGLPHCIAGIYHEFGVPVQLRGRTHGNT